jgi:spore coat protein U-like protein
MSNQRATFKALVIATLACAAGSASAAGSTTLNVSATVNTVCKFQSATVPIAFGSLDPDAGAQTVNTGVAYKCTNGAAAPSVAFASGTGSRNMTSGANSLAYSITLGATQAGTGFSAGQEKTLTIQAQIAASALLDAPAGTYTENVQLNITP